MSASPEPQQPDLEQLVQRMARRAADAVAGSVVELGTQLALARESLDGHAQALAEKDRQLQDMEAELARAHQVADQLRGRVAELEQPAEPPTD